MGRPRPRRGLVVALALGIALAIQFAGAGELADLHARFAPAASAPPDAASTGAEPKSSTLGEGVREVPSGGATGPVASSPRPGAKIDRIGIERGPCLVGCPVFTLIVARDGTFEYRGVSGVERTGSWRGRIEPGRVLQVMDVVADLEIAELAWSWTSPFLDNATSYLLVDRGGEPFVLENQGGAAPPRVWAVEQLIEGLLEHAAWESRDDAR